MSKLKTIVSYKLNVGHFLIVLLLSAGLTIGLFILSLILGWLCCMEPAAGPRMYSNLTLFVLITADLMILMLGLGGLYLNAKKKDRTDFQKSYLIIGILLIVLYLIFMPYTIFTNQ
jgi:heme A synthase